MFGRDARSGRPGGKGTPDDTVVLGIDPGLTRCGYAVLSPRGAGAATAVSLGVIRTPSTVPLAERLAILHEEISALLEEFSPSAVAVERVFFSSNVRTAMSVGQASGVVLALAARHGCAVAHYSPSQVKDAVAGWGAADKEQMQRMVRQRLGLATVPRPADAADAAAVALCHLAMAPFAARRDAAIAGSGQ